MPGRRNPTYVVAFRKGRCVAAWSLATWHSPRARRRSCEGGSANHRTSFRHEAQGSVAIAHPAPRIARWMLPVDGGSAALDLDAHDRERQAKDYP